MKKLKASDMAKLTLIITIITALLSPILQSTTTYYWENKPYRRRKKLSYQSMKVKTSLLDEFKQLLKGESKWMKTK